MELKTIRRSYRLKHDALRSRLNISLDERITDVEIQGDGIWVTTKETKK